MGIGFGLCDFNRIVVSCEDVSAAHNVQGFARPRSGTSSGNRNSQSRPNVAVICDVLGNGAHSKPGTDKQRCAIRIGGARPVRSALGLSTLDQLRYHHNHCGSVLPNHTPECFDLCRAAFVILTLRLIENIITSRNGRNEKKNVPRKRYAPIVEDNSYTLTQKFQPASVCLKIDNLNQWFQVGVSRWPAITNSIVVRRHIPEVQKEMIAWCVFYMLFILLRECGL